MAKNLPLGDAADTHSYRATILLVEDDAAVAYMLSDILTSSGYEVRQAA
ncbi:MAG: response regulator transcription factor, partial [Chloroflexi bacterium]|nr:response regulator transcription factor [Chloroflexota bacterium]